MFQALVTACFIANMNMCVVLEGQQWFKEREKCEARALRMAEDVHKYMKTHKAVSWTCRELPKGKLTA